MLVYVIIEILSRRIGTYGFTDLELNKPIICPIEAIKSMQEYSDQQTKENDELIKFLQDQAFNNSVYIDMCKLKNEELMGKIEGFENAIKFKNDYIQKQTYEIHKLKEQIELLTLNIDK